MNTTVLEAPTSLKDELIQVAKPHLKFLDNDAAIGLDLVLADAGLDSMASISLLLDIEDELNIPIPDELIEEDSFETLGSVLALIEKAKIAT